MRMFLIAAALLAACSSPSPHFFGVEPVKVFVKGWEIDVYAHEDRAEAIRLTADWTATSAEMHDRGVFAVEAATGWRVDRRTVTGDGSIVRMRRTPTP